jgi:hypothetical protein
MITIKRLKLIHKIEFKFILIVFFVTLKSFCFSQDSIFLKVHFLYGSKPFSKYKQTEHKWFGGIHGGHVGIEGDSNQILSFELNGKFHVFDNKKIKFSNFKIQSYNDFYEIFGGDVDSVKKAIVYIPITIQQKQKYDSIVTSYLLQTPYDYAFFGMRCSSASYEVLGQLNILKKLSYQKTIKKIFYPKKFRKILLKLAKENHWKIVIKNGSKRRKWEMD